MAKLFIRQSTLHWAQKLSWTALFEQKIERPSQSNIRMHLTLNIDAHNITNVLNAFSMILTKLR